MITPTDSGLLARKPCGARSATGEVCVSDAVDDVLELTASDRVGGGVVEVGVMLGGVVTAVSVAEVCEAEVVPDDAVSEVMALLVAEVVALVEVLHHDEK